MSLETYVRMVNKHKPKDMPATYCPVDIEKGCVTLGLSLIGFYPKGAKVVGTYDERMGTLKLFKKFSNSQIKRTENNKHE